MDRVSDKKLTEHVVLIFLDKQQTVVFRVVCAKYIHRYITIKLIKIALKPQYVPALTCASIASTDAPQSRIVNFCMMTSVCVHSSTREHYMYTTQTH